MSESSRISDWATGWTIRGGQFSAGIRDFFKTSILALWLGQPPSE